MKYTEKNNIVPRRKAVFLYILFFALGLSGGLFFSRNYKYLKTVQVRQPGYKLINPLLESETVGVVKELKPFRHKVDKYVGEIIRNGRATYISLYFRDLNNGLWFGINENEKFAPASLLKVPILIAYLKWAQDNPNLLKEKFRYSTRIYDLNQNIYPELNIEFGKTYTVDRLLTGMIAYSDNISKDLLLKHVDKEILHSVFADMGLEIPDVRTPEDYMSVVEYASFFRILFNASYLDRGMSEKALQYLTQVRYKEGLSAGIPPTLVVAHKFGERENADTGERQLHECGIIYYPNYPYLLCIMTRGRDFKELSGVIKDLSGYFYTEVSKHARPASD